MGPWLRSAALGVSVFISSALTGASANPVSALYGTTLDGTAVSTLGTSNVVVLFFVASDCPVSNRYLPEMQSLMHRFSGKPVRFWLVFPNPGETGLQVRTHLAAFGQNLPALLDPGQRLVALAGANVTPEAVLFLPGLREAYRGRIDDRYISFGHEKPQATRHDLADAISAALAGKPVPPSAAARPIGCSIVPLR